jgi:hypothetical protein
MERDDEKAEVEREQEALSRAKPEGLIGDTAENRNLTGSTTWETLAEQQDEADASPPDAATQ